MTLTLLEQHPGLLAALQGDMTPKFLATRSAAGMPNLVPLISLQPAGDQADILFFGNFLLRKSIANLKEDLRVAVLVITEALQGWVLQGDFLEFQRTGPYVDRQMSSSLLRYNAYTGIRDAGLIRICSVEAVFSISRLQVLRDYVLAWLASPLAARHGSCTEAVLPRPVRQEFGRMAAVKALTWLDATGYPTLAPALSLQPAGDRALVAWRVSSKPARSGSRAVAALQTPPHGAVVAANVLTPDAVSYQVKGNWIVLGPAGAIQVQEVYAGGPPIPGGRIA